jgi:hypothetical protein
MIFTPLLHKNCKAEGAEILQEYYFAWRPQTHQLPLKSEKGGLWNVMICHGMFWRQHIPQKRSYLSTRL